MELLGLLAGPFAESAGALGLADARLAYEGDPPTEGELEARLERDLERGLDRRRTRICTTSRSRPPAATCARSARRGSSGPPCSPCILAESALLAERRDEPPLLLLDDVLSELDPQRRRVLVEQVAGPRPDADHRDDRRRAAGRAGAAARGLAGAVDGRVGDGAARRRDLRGELSRFGPQAGMPEVLAAWPDGGRADGRRQRLAGADRARRDAAREHVVVRVGVRARPAARRRSSSGCRQKLGESAPKALRFAVGHLPEPSPEEPARGANGGSRADRGSPATGGRRSPPGSRTRSCEIECKERSRSASRKARPTTVSDTLTAARK